MDIKIVTPKQLKSIIKDETLSRSNILIEGLTINEDDLNELMGLDPKVLNFNNCNFKDINFDCIFIGNIGLQELIITNSHLTDQQGLSILCTMYTECLHYLDFSNNDLGKTAEGKKSFLEGFIEYFHAYNHLNSINLENNGFDQDEKNKFTSYIKENYGKKIIKMISL